MEMIPIACLSGKFADTLCLLMVKLDLYLHYWCHNAWLPSIERSYQHISIPSESRGGPNSFFTFIRFNTSVIKLSSVANNKVSSLVRPNRISRDPLPFSLQIPKPWTHQFSAPLLRWPLKIALWNFGVWQIPCQKYKCDNLHKEEVPTTWGSEIFCILRLKVIFFALSALDSTCFLTFMHQGIGHHWLNVGKLFRLFVCDRYWPFGNH